MFERTISLIGEEKFKIIEKQKILIVGIGGVGGIVLEALVRTGFTNITIIDYDVFEESNLNRQLISNISSINKKKVIEAKNRMKKINPNVNINALDMFLDEHNISKITNYDFIVDTCDSVNTKLELYKYAHKKNISIISSMGMGNRRDISKIYITSLNRTINDPLAKKIRHLCKDENINTNIKVLASSEIPKIDKKISSIFTVVNTAGIILADYIINETLKK